MKQIPVAEIDDGMVLAESVYGNSGQIIFKEGSTLKKDHAHRIAARGIQYVSIQGETAAEAVLSMPEPAHSAEANLATLFSKSINQPITKALYTQVLKYLNTRRKGV